MAGTQHAATRRACLAASSSAERAGTASYPTTLRRDLGHDGWIDVVRCGVTIVWVKGVRSIEYQAHKIAAGRPGKDRRAETETDLEAVAEDVGELRSVDCHRYDGKPVGQGHVAAAATGR